MRRVAFVAVCFLVICCAVSAEDKAKPAKASTQPSKPELQAKIEKAWADFVKKDEKAISNLLADDAIEIWADSKGPRDKKSTLDGMQKMTISKYELSNFHFKPVGANGQVAMYDATVAFQGAPQVYKIVVSEVWRKSGKEWKLVHYQETEVK